MRIVQLLNWDLNSITDILDDVKSQKFDAIQINPMQPFKGDDTFHWWLSYQPIGFRIGNMFGTKEDLERLCYEGDKRGISIIVDVICNHVANAGEDNVLSPHPTVDKEILSYKEFFKDKIMLQNFKNRYCATHHLIGLPGLNLKNNNLQDIIFRYLTELKDCGVKGFRFDAAKHIGLPNDGVDFFEKVKSFLEENSLFGYGEFLGKDKQWQEEFVNYIPILTHFTTDLDDKDKVVTYFESHDTFLNDDHHSTRMIKTGDIINIQWLLNNAFENTIFYVRPKHLPFNPYGNELQGNDRTLAHFEQDFLTDERVKSANNIDKEKVLSKRL